MVRERATESIHHKTVVFSTVTIRALNQHQQFAGGFRLPVQQVVMNSTAILTGKVFCPDSLFLVFCVSDAIAGAISRQPSSAQTAALRILHPFT